ncbi:MAG: (d)CMP kinase [Verrucomicrobiota bacterium]
MPEDSSFKIIAIDGGAATGKSSTSKGIAERLGLMHVDTGAHYRSVTYALLQAEANPEMPDAIPNLLEQLQLDTTLEGRSAKISINGVVPRDAEIRSPEVNAAVARFATIKAVRNFLFNYQRSQADVGRANGFAGLIMEGRDIGSVILPDAPYRFFLHADEKTRAARRAKEGQTDSIAARDKLDSTRKTAPLVCPNGATQVDTAPMTLEEVVDHICKIIAGPEYA